MSRMSSLYQPRGSGIRLGLPDVQMFRVAGRRNVETSLARRAVERRPDVFLGIGKKGKRNLERSPGLQLIDVAQELRDDLLVLSVAAFGNILLLDRTEVHWKVVRFCLGSHFSSSHTSSVTSPPYKPVPNVYLNLRKTILWSLAYSTEQNPATLIARSTHHVKLAKPYIFANPSVCKDLTRIAETLIGCLQR